MTSPALYVAMFLVLLAAPPSKCKVTLRHLDTEYIPETYIDGEARFRYDTGAAYSVGFDPRDSSPYLYIAGESVIHVLDYTNPGEIKRVAYHQSDIGFTYTALDVCGDVVAASFDNEEHPLDGKVYIFRAYDDHVHEIKLLQTIEVGAQPTMVKFTANCQKVLVPLLGGVVLVDDQVTDPEGAVAIITLKNDAKENDVMIVDFTRFNEKWEKYVKEGVRWTWRGQNSDINNTFSQGLQPSFITIGNDSTAYVCLQVNNAIATLNVDTEEVTELYPLGASAWKTSTLDPSDRDGGIHMNSWDIHGMRQPRGIQLVRIDDRSYVLTADAGAYTRLTEEDLGPGFTWKDMMRGEDLTQEGRLSQSLGPDLFANLADDRQLGRIYMSNIDGIDESSGLIEKLYTYGGRSFSILKASDMSVEYNSQNSLETQIAAQYPSAFNAETEDEFGSPDADMDSKSPKMGPLPSCVEYAELNLGTGSKRLVFVGMDKPGLVGIYSVADDFATSKKVTFESLHYSGGDPDDTWWYSWEQRESWDLGVIDLKVYTIPGKKTSQGEHILAVAGHTTDTVSFYAIYDDKHGGDGRSTAGAIAITVVCIVVLGVVCAAIARYVVVKRRKESYPRTRLEETT